MSGAPVAAEAGELLARVRRLEMVARGNVAGHLLGDYATSIPGQGYVFHESRKYVPGEPARSIDWNITARLGEPYVKVHLEERQRDVVVAVDVSPSMHAGFAGLTKLELAIELAATLALAAVETGDRLGWVLFADRVLDSMRPAGGRAQLFSALRALLDHAGPWRRPVELSDPRAAIHAIEAMRGRRLVVFLISDFIDHDVPEDLKYLSARHDVSLLHVYDPLEYEGSDSVRFLGRAAEGRGVPGSTFPGGSGSLEEMTGFLAREAARYRIAVTSFATTEPAGQALGRFLFAKGRRVLR